MCRDSSRWLITIPGASIETRQMALSDRRVGRVVAHNIRMCTDRHRYIATLSGDSHRRPVWPPMRACSFGEALARRAPGASRRRACSPVVETDNRATTLTSTTELAGNCRCPGKYRPACTSPGLRPEYSRNRTARTKPAGSWPFAGTYRMSCLRAYRRSHKPTTLHRGLLPQAIRLWSSSWAPSFLINMRLKR